MLLKEDLHATPARSDHTGVGSVCAPVFTAGLASHPTLASGAMLAPGARTVTATSRVMGLATERGFTNDHRVLNRATWSARQGSRILLRVAHDVAGARRGDDRPWGR